jgi:hypothetical protein
MWEPRRLTTHWPPRPVTGRAYLYIYHLDPFTDFAKIGYKQNLLPTIVQISSCDYITRVVWTSNPARRFLKNAIFGIVTSCSFTTAKPSYSPLWEWQIQDANNMHHYICNVFYWVILFCWYQKSISETYKAASYIWNVEHTNKFVIQEISVLYSQHLRSALRLCRLFTVLRATWRLTKLLKFKNVKVHYMIRPIWPSSRVHVGDLHCPL